MIWIIVGIAGALGSLARFSIGMLLAGPSEGFPWATLLCNLSGSLLLAGFSAWILGRTKVNRLLQPFIAVGLLGSFTTLSTFSVETFTLFQLKQYGAAVLYIAISSIGGLLLAWLGWRLVEMNTRSANRVGDQR